MWGKNNTNDPNQRPRRNNHRGPAQQDVNGRNKRNQRDELDDRQNYSQNLASNPFNIDPDIESNNYTGNRYQNFNAGESRDDHRADYSSNYNPTYGRTSAPSGRDDPAEGSRWASDFSNRSGTNVSNRQGQTGGSPFSSQYGLNYGSPREPIQHQGDSSGSRYGSNFGTSYGDRNQNWGERSDYGSEHVDLNSGADRDRWSQSGLNSRGQHLGKGPKGYRRSDERIHEDAAERLTHDAHIDATDIEVGVLEGVLTLTGTVEDRRTKRLAEDCVEGISGVADIKNDLRVQSKQDLSSRDSLSSMKQAGKSGKGLM